LISKEKLGNFSAEKETYSPKGHSYITNYSPTAWPLKPCNSKLTLIQISQKGCILCKESIILKRKAIIFKRLGKWIILN